MNQTSREPIIKWEMTDGKPTAHVEVSETHMSLKQLLDLVIKLRLVFDEMDWRAADYLGAGAARGMQGNMHILEKSTYEQNQQCLALCGKSPGQDWHTVFTLRDWHPGGKGVCKACTSKWEQAQKSEGKAD